MVCISAFFLVPRPRNNGLVPPHVILPSRNVHGLEELDIGVLGGVHNLNVGQEGHEVGGVGLLPDVLLGGRGRQGALPLTNHIGILNVGVLVHKVVVVGDPPAVVPVALLLGLDLAAAGGALGLELLEVALVGAAAGVVDAVVVLLEGVKDGGGALEHD